MNNILNEYINMLETNIINDYKNNTLDPNKYPDILMFISELYSVNKKGILEEIGYNICKSIKQYTEIYGLSKYNPISMMGGFGFYCFSVRVYAKNTGNLLKFSNQLDALLFQNLLSKTKKLDSFQDLKYDDYDCIYGIAGAVNYLNLEHDFMFLEAINSTGAYFKQLCKNDANMNFEPAKFTISNHNQYLEEDKKKFINGHINFGLSHGMMGPMVAINNICQKMEDDELKILLNDLIEVYVIHQKNIGGVMYWPSKLPSELFGAEKIPNEFYHMAGSWCYGNLPIIHNLSKMYLKGTKNTYDEKFYQAIKSMDNFKYGLVSPAICHGYASVLACILSHYRGKSFFGLDIDLEKIVNTMISKSKENSKLDLKTLNKNDRVEGHLNDYSFLTGSTGIGCVILDLLYGVNSYANLLMI